MVVQEGGAVGADAGIGSSMGSHIRPVAPLWLDARASERAVVRCWSGKPGCSRGGRFCVFSTALRRRIPFAKLAQTFQLRRKKKETCHIFF